MLEFGGFPGRPGVFAIDSQTIPCGQRVLESVTILDMGAQTFEGVVEHGQIRLDSEVHLLEGAKVYVIVPATEAEPRHVHLRSPRLAVRELAVEFKMEVVEP